MTTSSDQPASPATESNGLARLTSLLDQLDLAYEPVSPERLAITMPGEHKQRITVLLDAGHHALTIQAFVARRPEENTEAVYRWLLERNRRMYAVAFAIDAVGDIYLAGRMPVRGLDVDELDRVLGCVLEYADTSFNTILRLGFEGSIRREWQWRLSRGESTANLQAFTDLAGP